MIKNLLFDFGDVFINLDKRKPYDEFKSLGFAEPDEDMITFNQQYEKGLITTEAFCEYYINQAPAKISKDKVIQAWNSILLDFPLHRLQFIQKLASVRNFNLILLSNTNELHIDWIRTNVPFYLEFKACFNKFYLSQHINMRKPDNGIYAFVLNENDLLPEETLFIDDTKENTDAAKALGFHVWNINPKTEDVVDLLTVNQHLF